MKEPKRCAGILDYLKEEASCVYISDLYQKSYLPSIKKVVEGMDPSQYTLRQWNEAVGYISKQKLEFGTIEEVIDFLLKLK